ncbi:hypothetical protein JG687_00013754 [Phytophthora cactorum]|uniref:Uncharacterized protein n=1 Tax=Phytophthora cactorum TaxID=29920 RepID=A0A8T1U3D7_9STRA|nr:hypothetical protein JG687_00013754 [Phytophthora cactorum]
MRTPRGNGLSKTGLPGALLSADNGGSKSKTIGDAATLKRKQGERRRPLGSKGQPARTKDLLTALLLQVRCQNASTRPHRWSDLLSLSRCRQTRVRTAIQSGTRAIT